MKKENRNVSYKSFIKKSREELSKLLFSSDNNLLLSLDSKLKADQTWITTLDLSISNLIKKELQESDFNDHVFYCEEDHHLLDFPALILDPVDGTQGLVMGMPEYAISLLIMKEANLSSTNFEVLVWNFGTNFIVDSSDHQPLKKLTEKLNNTKIHGLVSRSEWMKGLFKKFIEHDHAVEFHPLGSIAYKLSLLSIGSADFIISMKPKNIWDIAAGTMLCIRSGFKFYENGVEVKNWNKPLYNPPLLWCKPSDLEKIDKIFNFKNEIK